MKLSKDQLIRSYGLEPTGDLREMLDKWERQERAKYLVPILIAMVVIIFLKLLA